MTTSSNFTYTFFGTPEFAAVVLEKLIAAGFVPSAVVCNPDRPAGRKKIITPPPTKLLAQKHNIPVLQPEKLSLDFTENHDEKIRQIDFFIVAAYAKIIPKEILDIPKLGSVGVHPSLLPKHRGPSPIQAAILGGEKETGVTLFLMDEKIDHGPILATRVLPIATRDNYENLSQKLAEVGAKCLIETLPKFMNKEITPQEQNHTKATHTKKFKTEDGFVDLKKDDPIITERKIRALNPEPGIWTISTGSKPINVAEGKRVKLLGAELVSGRLKLKKIQIEGKKPQLI